MEVWIRSPHKDDLPLLRSVALVDPGITSSGNPTGRWSAAFMTGVEAVLATGRHRLGGQFARGRQAPRGSAAVWVTVLHGSRAEVRARAFVSGFPMDSYRSGGVEHLFQSILDAVNDLVPPEPRHVTATRAIELLIDRLTRDLERENSELRLALDEAHIQAAFLRGQVAALREAAAMNRPVVTKSVLAVIGAVMLAVITGAAGGAAQSVADNALKSRDREPTVAAYVQECEAIQQMLGD